MPNTFLNVTDWFRSIKYYSHLSRKAGRRVEQLKLPGPVKRHYTKEVFPCNFCCLVLCELLESLPWLPRKTSNPSYSFPFFFFCFSSFLILNFCLKELRGWFLMEYAVEGLCLFLAIMKTCSGITSWLLQAKCVRHCAVLSE